MPRWASPASGEFAQSPEYSVGQQQGFYRSEQLRILLKSQLSMAFVLIPAFALAGAVSMFAPPRRRSYSAVFLETAEKTKKKFPIGGIAGKAANHLLGKMGSMGTALRGALLGQPKKGLHIYVGGCIIMNLITCSEDVISLVPAHQCLVVRILHQCPLIIAILWPNSRVLLCNDAPALSFLISPTDAYSDQPNSTQVSLQ